jgi:prophage maintenance system killer protein
MRKNKIWYPTIKEIENVNKLMVSKFRATKAERFQVRSRQQISNAILETKDFPGSIEDKAAVLVRKLQYHPFASANRRTAYFVMNKFLWKNRGYSIAKNKLKGKEFMSKIRRGELSHDQIKKEVSLVK